MFCTEFVGESTAFHHKNHKISLKLSFSGLLSALCPKFAR